MSLYHFRSLNVNPQEGHDLSELQGVSKKSRHSWETKTLGTSYSETTYLLDLKLWQQGVLMSTPCCQISTAYRLVVSGYEVPKVLVSQECRLFFGTPCSTAAHVKDDPKKSPISITYCGCDMGIPQPR